MAKIKDRRKNLKNDTQDFFDDDFEVIYEDDLDDLLKNSFIEDDNEPDDYYYDDEFDNDDDYDIDDYDEDDYDNRRNNSKSSKRKDSNKSKKKHSLPNVVSPAAKAAKTGTRLIFKILNMILKPFSVMHLVNPIYVGLCSRMLSPGDANAEIAEITPPSTPFS